MVLLHGFSRILIVVDRVSKHSISEMDGVDESSSQYEYGNYYVRLRASKGVSKGSGLRPPEPVQITNRRSASTTARPSSLRIDLIVSQLGPLGLER